MVRVIKKKSLKKKLLSLLSTGRPFIILLLLAAGILVTFELIKKPQEIREHAATPLYNRILWQGVNWYVEGVNMPWYNWGCDFGCNSTIGKSGGVSTNLTTLSSGLAKVQGNGMHVVRWWVFPGDPWQIDRGSTGPTGVNPAVYTDFDAALKLADQYDIYYDFVLFSAPTAMPSSWETDTTQRAKLAQVLGTLFAHYSGNPRILSWEIYNEPENDIWNNKIAQQPVVDTGTAIAQSVHSNSPGTLVTVGSLFADGMKMWLNAGLDYYSPHWYDYMSSGDYCMICNNYDHYASWGVNKPIVVGEFYTADGTSSPYSSDYRLKYWFDNGFAGSWAWSLFPDRTSDKLAVDFSAEKNFSLSHAEVGPHSNTVTTPTISAASPAPTSLPTPTPLPSSTPIPTSSDNVPPSISITSPQNGSSVRRNSKVSINVNATDDVKVVKVMFYVNSTLICTDTSASYSCTWRVPGKRSTTYTIKATAVDSSNNTSSQQIYVTSK